MGRKSRGAVFGVWLGVVVVLAIAWQARAEAPVKITVSYSALNPTLATVWVAEDEKIFEKYGLEAKLVQLKGGSGVVQGVLSGGTQFGVGSYEAMISANLRGANLVSLGVGSSVKASFRIHARKGIEGAKDLIGKTIACTNPGASTDWTSEEGLRLLGVKPDQYRKVFLGGFPSLLAALRSGQVDAAALAAPFAQQAESHGFPMVVDLSSLPIYGGSGIIVNRQWAAEHPEVVDAFLKAFVEARFLFKTNEAVATASMAKWLRVPQDSTLRNVYQWVDGLLAWVPISDAEAWQFAIDHSSDAKAKGEGVKPENFFDNSYLLRLVESGWVKALAERYGVPDTAALTQ